jgi:opacity protein-like surface antigen
MTFTPRTLTTLLLAGSTLLAGTAALAQSSSISTAGNPLYSTGNAYVDLGIGRTDFSLDGGTGVFRNEKRDTSYKLSAGTYFNQNLGLEIGYNDFGSIERGGGKTRAEGVNMSAVARMPLAENFNLLGRLGATYGRTRVSSVAGSGVPSGNENGFGLHLGVGGEYVFTPQMSVVLQYALHDLKFAGGSRERIGVTSLGLRYRF